MQKIFYLSLISNTLIILDANQKKIVVNNQDFSLFTLFKSFLSIVAWKIHIELKKNLGCFRQFYRV